MRKWRIIYNILCIAFLISLELSNCSSWVTQKAPALLLVIGYMLDGVVYLKDNTTIKKQRR